jgi:hypothetical protein
VAWYALAALAGLEGVWTALLAVRIAQLREEVDRLHHRASGLEDQRFSSYQRPP